MIKTSKTPWARQITNLQYYNQKDNYPTSPSDLTVLGQARRPYLYAGRWPALGPAFRPAFKMTFRPAFRLAYYLYCNVLFKIQNVQAQGGTRNR